MTARAGRNPLERSAAQLVAISLLGLLAAEDRARLVLPVAATAIFCLLQWKPGLRLRERTWTGLSAVALGFFFVDVAMVSRSALLAAVHLLLYLLVNKTYHRTTTRDHDHLLVISFLFQLSICVLAVEIVVVFIFATYMVVALGLLELLHQRRERESAELVVEAAKGPAARRTALGAAAMVLLAGGVLFFVFPRVGAGTFQASLAQPQIVSGFSAEVNLDEIGKIKENNTLVARIRPLATAATGSPLSLLRAVAYRHFDGKRWRRDEPLPGLLPATSLKFDRPGPGRGSTWFELTVEPLSPPIVLLPVRTVGVNGIVSWVQRDASGSVLFGSGRRARGRQTYEAGADLTPVAWERLREDRFKGDPADVALPRLDPRIGALATSLGAPGAERVQLVRAVLEHLGRDFSYSLDTPGGDDPLSRFLFEKRAGHCELFATAAAVLLRSRGIAVRVVNGFRVSEWSAVGGYFIVRQADAHAWIEVLLGDAGWVTFDPTPPDPDRSRWTFGLRSLSQAVDFFLYHWDRHVISWGLSDQQEVVEALRDWLAVLPARLRPLAMPIGVVTVAVVVALVFGRIARRRRRGHESEATVLYQALRRELAAAGMALGPSTGPGDLRRRVAGLPAAERIVDLYVAVRFAGRGMDREAAVHARRALGALRAELRRSPPQAPVASAPRA